MNIKLISPFFLSYPEKTKEKEKISNHFDRRREFYVARWR